MPATQVQDSARKRVVIQAPEKTPTAPSSGSVNGPQALRERRSILPEELKDFDGLALGRDESEQVIECIQNQDFEGAVTIIRSAFVLRPPPPPPSHILHVPSSAIKYQPDREEEDATFRDVILSKYYTEACSFAVSVGFTSWQLAVWITLFSEGHKENLAQIRELDGSAHRLSCLEIFSNLLMDYNYKRLRRQAFTKQEMIMLIDYFTQSYAQHMRLITHVFTQLQDIEITYIHTHLEEPNQITSPNGGYTKLVLPPLKEGIPAEKWDDWCRAEEERKRLEREKEEEAAETARKLAEAEAKAAADASVIEEVKDTQKAASILQRLVLPPPPIPSPLSLFPERVVSTKVADPQIVQALADPNPPVMMMPNESAKSHALNPAAIGAILSSTIDEHISILASYLEKQMSHQIGEMQAIIEKREKEKKGKEEDDKKEKQERTVTAGKKGADKKSAGNARDVRKPSGKAR
ncbi:uncharacterized protein SPPG_03537 [Spizellomyces punctatus DAOM BR117]|uniref:Uncharacterized protein n=1 Tax=Spizellomyces punctatus (strain DAOM BR117) TaxID=645134 RepID=A0A0L0HLQ8_SPIPD|nr:uncharacterized protein SPPG_03537 [Spizellomyces punctatus DAOM BR117]KND01744.1 hypothetical protein SPPG_03537 [Spizellomyces punctatus DAOM BR117]|eukprot:XP_016609783.1 hypothetical protein SPPG_03537 [Spizellomyces punctatus DAOM BR117]